MQMAQLAFSRGTLDPSLHGRVDSQAYATGLSQSENALVLPQGGVWNRPGTKYLTDVTIAGSEDEGLMVPFVFSVDQSYVLVFAEGQMRVIKDGGMVQSGGSDYYLDTSTQMSSADLSKVRWAQVADELYLTSHDFAPLKITRVADDNWTIATITYSSGTKPTDKLPSGQRYAFTTAVTEDGEGIAVTLNIYIVDSSGVEYLYTPGFPWTGTYTQPYLYQPLVWKTDDIVSQPWSSLTLASGWTESPSTAGTYYYATNMGASAEPDGIMLYKAPTSSTETEVKRWTKTTSNPPENLWAWGDFDTLGYDTVYIRLPGGVAPSSLYDYCLCTYLGYNYRVYGAVGNAEPFGLLAETNIPLIEWTSDIIPQYAIQPFIDDDPIDTSDSTTWPLAVAFQGQRTWYGGATATPNQINASILGTLDGFGYHTPLRDDDAIDVTIASTRVNNIQHLTARDDYVLTFTDGAIWRAYGTGGIIAPTTINFDRICEAFVSDAPPLDVGERLLYTDRLGRALELARGANIVEEPVDISLHAQSLLRGYTIVSWCYQNAPERTLWAVRSDGKVLSCTIVPEYDVWAWSLHEIAGTGAVALSCAAIKDGARDKAYFIVQRTVDGSTVNYVEELQDRYISNRTDAWFLDSALSYSGVATGTLTGLDHLEGESVNVLSRSDGITYTGLTVSGGSITLPDSATTTNAVIGLGYTTTIETLDINAPDGQMLGLYHTVPKVRIKIRDSMVFKAGQVEAELFDIEIPAYGYTDATSNLSTGVLEHLTDSVQHRNGGLFFKNANPIPMTIDAIIPAIETEEAP